MEKRNMQWQCPPVVENILKYLCARDLSSCACVCKLWRVMSNNEQSRRKFVDWFFEVGVKQDHENSNAQYEIMPSSGSGSLYSFQEKMAKVRILPSFCLVLLSSYTIEEIEKVFPICETTASPLQKRRRQAYFDKLKLRMNKVVKHFLKPMLPVHCSLYCIASPGIIGSHADCSSLEVEQGSAITGLILPDFPGVTVQHLSIEEVGKSMVPLRFKEKPIKCLLMFMNQYVVNHIQDIVDNCLSYNQGVKFAIGGALVVVPPNELGTCFAFSGENFEAASVIIDDSVTDIPAELESFKKTGLLDNHCFAIMFACVDKGVDLYGVPNYESGIFNRLYPNVPLMGVFGNGEIGVHYLPNVDKEEDSRKAKERKFQFENCVRAYNTVFVLLSVKRPE